MTTSGSLLKVRPKSCLFQRQSSTYKVHTVALDFAIDNSLVQITTTTGDMEGLMANAFTIGLSLATNHEHSIASLKYVSTEIVY